MDIDVSKENIQPLRGGRNLVQLGTALQAQSDVDAQKQLQQQKEWVFKTFNAAFIFWLLLKTAITICYRFIMVFYVLFILAEKFDSSAEIILKSYEISHVLA